MTPWIYDGREITDEDLDGYKCFVYCITNLVDGRKYIGKKRLQFMSRKKVRGHKRKTRHYRQSDWRTYWGSSTELQSDISRLGTEAFSREIIRLCRTLSESNYYELREQMVNDVLFHPDKYYNSYIGTRVSRKQLGIKE